jgi:peptide/nickel transport system substrate-binding protein
MDVVPLERGAMIAQWSAGDYDAIYFAIESDSLDPGRNLEFWLSSGSFHLWHANQAKPATAWEARVDSLMTRQVGTMDPSQRRALFGDVQRLLYEHAPALYFAAPKVTIATSARLGGVIPSVLAPGVLWNAERLFVASAPGARR